jgi:hypothetical protein
MRALMDLHRGAEDHCFGNDPRINLVPKKVFLKQAVGILLLFESLVYQFVAVFYLIQSNQTGKDLGQTNHQKPEFSFFSQSFNKITRNKKWSITHANYLKLLAV